MKIAGLKHAKTLEDGTLIHMWNVRLEFARHLVMPGFSIAVHAKPVKSDWAGPGFTRKNDESADSDATDSL